MIAEAAVRQGGCLAISLYDASSSIEACGSTSTLPKQRKGARLAPTMLRSIRASPGSPVVMSG